MVKGKNAVVPGSADWWRAREEKADDYSMIWMVFAAIFLVLSIVTAACTKEVGPLTAFLLTVWPSVLMGLIALWMRKRRNHASRMAEEAEKTVSIEYVVED